MRTTNEKKKVTVVTTQLGKERRKTGENWREKNFSIMLLTGAVDLTAHFTYTAPWEINVSTRRTCPGTRQMFRGQNLSGMRPRGSCIIQGNSVNSCNYFQSLTFPLCKLPLTIITKAFLSDYHNSLQAEFSNTPLFLKL